MNINELITDDELEDCFEGSTSVDLVREIFTKQGVVCGPKMINPNAFAEWFAYGIEGFIDAEHNSLEWQEAWAVNRDWGLSIANNINDLLEEKE